MDTKIGIKSEVITKGETTTDSTDVAAEATAGRTVKVESCGNDAIHSNYPVQVANVSATLAGLGSFASSMPLNSDSLSPHSAFYIQPTAMSNVYEAKGRSVQVQMKNSTILSETYSRMLAAAPANNLTTFPRFRNLEPMLMDLDNVQPLLPVLQNIRDRAVYRLSVELMRGAAAKFPQDMNFNPAGVVKAISMLQYEVGGANNNLEAKQETRQFRRKKRRALRNAWRLVELARIRRDYFRMLESAQDGEIQSPVAGRPPLRLVDVMVPPAWSPKNIKKRQQNHQSSEANSSSATDNSPKTANGSNSTVKGLKKKTQNKPAVKNPKSRKRKKTEKQLARDANRRKPKQRKQLAVSGLDPSVTDFAAPSPSTSGSSGKLNLAPHIQRRQRHHPNKRIVAYFRAQMNIPPPTVVVFTTSSTIASPERDHQLKVEAPDEIDLARQTIETIPAMIEHGTVMTPPVESVNEVAKRNRGRPRKIVWNPLSRRNKIQPTTEAQQTIETIPAMSEHGTVMTPPVESVNEVTKRNRGRPRKIVWNPLGRRSKIQPTTESSTSTLEAVFQSQQSHVGRPKKLSLNTSNGCRKIILVASTLQAKSASQVDTDAKPLTDSLLDELSAVQRERPSNCAADSLNDDTKHTDMQEQRRPNVEPAEQATDESPTVKRKRGRPRKEMVFITTPPVRPPTVSHRFNLRQRPVKIGK